MANTFNTFFIGKVKKLHDSITGNVSVDPLIRLQRWLGNSRDSPVPVFSIQQTTLLKLRKIIAKIKGNHACGIDMIDGYSIMLAFPLIEDKQLTENYRPVSNLIFVGMICEKVIAEQVFYHFDQNKLWHQNYHGFHPNHSTATALINLTDLWLQAADNGKLTAALLLDLSAAFDLVDHQVLIGKLRLYGLDETSLKWVTSYLHNRSQYVLVESVLSDPLPTGEVGVPQGSILGPLLYLIFDNDFPARGTNTLEDGDNYLDEEENAVQGNSILYADDNTDNISAIDTNTLKTMIQREADMSTRWVHDNKLVCSDRNSS